ncbi:MAG: dephospho-CoA kinase [Microbacterium sp.]|nr:dephospho-CoA kinase [Microbacterium sp.]
MQLIALTGGIASGKSTIARRLAEHGAVVVDADAVAREVVEPGQPALAAIRSRFGDGVIRLDGTLDRPALGAIVFADDPARLDLNAITHQAIWHRTRQRFAEAAAADPDAIVVYDVPLLVEGGASRDPAFDLIVVANAPADVRRQRLIDERGMDPAEADRRIASQAGDAERLAVADVVIDTAGTIEQTIEGADELWHRLSAAP